MTTGIVAFAFGAPSTIPQNRELAETVASYALGLASHELPFLVYTQREIPAIPDIEPAYVRYITPDPKAQPTLRIARWAVGRAIAERGASQRTLVVVAAEPHLWRCVRDVRYAVYEREVESIIKVVAHHSKNKAWFCRESAQPRTRSAMAWWPRELILRCMPMRLYAKVAG